MPTPVLREKHGAVAVLTLNRPEVLNAYDTSMRDALYESLQWVRDDPEIRALVLCGNGRAFCSGGDLNEFGSAPSPVRAREVRWQRDVWGLLKSLPKATMAAVHGPTVGGGIEMAMLCDLRIAADDAVFAFPETARAMIPGVGGTQSAPRMMGMSVALEMILTGRPMAAKEALHRGLVSRVVSARSLRSTALRAAHRLAELRPSVVATLKTAVRAATELPLRDGLVVEQRLASIVRYEDTTR